MNKALLLLALMLGVGTANADWELQQTRDGNWITTSAGGGNQLIVGDAPESIHFLLALSINSEEPPLLEQAFLTIDRFDPEPVQLRLLEKRPESRLFRIDLTGGHNDRLVRRMIAGLVLRFGYASEDNIQNFVQFSLLGFTAAWKDLRAVNQGASQVIDARTGGL